MAWTTAAAGSLAPGGCVLLVKINRCRMPLSSVPGATSPSAVAGVESAVQRVLHGLVVLMPVLGRLFSLNRRVDRHGVRLGDRPLT
ncbi:MAG TPA: hypothetical protein VFY88_09195, partial [Intrasporangium sp.]|nr:hypothetical protein [Intrasporangium sp.]